jgi:hypothetical protein
MDLANMRREGVRNLIAYCLNDSCRHQALIDVSSCGDQSTPTEPVRTAGGVILGTVPVPSRISRMSEAPNLL